MEEETTGTLAGSRFHNAPPTHGHDDDKGRKQLHDEKYTTSTASSPRRRSPFSPPAPLSSPVLRRYLPVDHLYAYLTSHLAPPRPRQGPPRLTHRYSLLEMLHRDCPNYSIRYPPSSGRHFCVFRRTLRSPGSVRGTPRSSRLSGRRHAYLSI